MQTPEPVRAPPDLPTTLTATIAGATSRAMSAIALVAGPALVVRLAAVGVAPWSSTPAAASTPTVSRAPTAPAPRGTSSERTRAGPGFLAFGDWPPEAPDPPTDGSSLGWRQTRSIGWDGPPEGPGSSSPAPPSSGGRLIATLAAAGRGFGPAMEKALRSRRE